MSGKSTRQCKLSIQTTIDSSIRSRSSPKSDEYDHDNNFKQKSAFVKKSSKTATITIYAFLIILCLLLYIISQFVSLSVIDHNSSHKVKENRVLDKVLIEPSILSKDNESYHTFSLDVEKIQLCPFNNEFNKNNILESQSAGSIVDENSYYTRQVNIKYRSWIYGQLCITPHSHEHIIELYLSKTEHLGSKLNDNIDCDIYISGRNTLPQINDWDFRSNNIGSDHIKIPLYLDEFKNSKGSIIIGLYGRGNIPDVNQCTLTVKINTFENEELLHKFNLRRGQVLLPRDLGLTSKRQK